MVFAYLLVEVHSTKSKDTNEALKKLYVQFWELEKHPFENYS